MQELSESGFMFIVLIQKIVVPPLCFLPPLHSPEIRHINLATKSHEGSGNANRIRNPLNLH